MTEMDGFCPYCGESFAACACDPDHDEDPCRICGRGLEDCDCESSEESLRMRSRIEAWRAEDEEIARRLAAAPPAEDAPPAPPILTFFDLLGPDWKPE